MTSHLNDQVTGATGLAQCPTYYVPSKYPL